MKNNAIRNWHGMFYIVKGIGMIAIVFFHSVSLSSINMTARTAAYYCTLPFYPLLSTMIMPMFFLISGYGFRKDSFKKSIQQQSNLILKPYLIATIGTVILHFLTRLILSHSIRTATLQTWNVLGGLLLALPQNRVIHGTLFYFCGTMWYFAALFIGWILLDAIMLTVPEKYWAVAIAAAGIAGWAIGSSGLIFFCIPQGLIAVFFLYAGYLIKSRNLFQRMFFFQHWHIVLIASLICIIAAVITGTVDNMANCIWGLGPISIFSAAIIAAAVLNLALLANNKTFWGKAVLSSIGANSLYVFLLHTVEMHGIPWYLLQEKLPNAPLLADLITLVLRTIFITAVVSAILFVQAKAAERN